MSDFHVRVGPFDVLKAEDGAWDIWDGGRKIGDCTKVNLQLFHVTFHHDGQPPTTWVVTPRDADSEALLVAQAVSTALVQAQMKQEAAWKGSRFGARSPRYRAASSAKPAAKQASYGSSGSSASPSVQLRLLAHPPDPSLPTLQVSEMELDNLDLHKLPSMNIQVMRIGGSSMGWLPVNQPGIGIGSHHTGSIP